MEILLLSVSLSLTTAQQVQEPRLFRVQDILGSWFIHALADIKELPVVSTSTMVILERGGGTLQTSFTQRTIKHCQEVNSTLERTAMPGRYRVSGSSRYMQVERIPEPGYLVLYYEGGEPGEIFRSAQLLCRDSYPRLNGLREFREFSQHKKLPLGIFFLQSYMKRCHPKSG